MIGFLFLLLIYYLSRLEFESGVVDSTMTLAYMRGRWSEILGKRRRDEAKLLTVCMLIVLHKLTEKEHEQIAIVVLIAKNICRCRSVTRLNV